MRNLLPSLLLLFVAAAPAVAAVSPEESRVLDRWELEVRAFETSIETVVRFDEPGGDQGTELGFEPILGLDDSETVVGFSAARMFGRRHQLRLAYSASDREATRLIQQEIVVRGQRIPIDAVVDSFFDAEFLELDYTYWLASSERTAFGITAGIFFFTLETGLRTTIDLPGDIVVGLGTRLDFDVPAPLFGFELRHALARRLIFSLVANGISFSEVEDFSGDVIRFAAGLEFRVTRSFAVGARYAFRDFDVRSRDASELGQARYEVDGPLFFAGLRF